MDPPSCKSPPCDYNDPLPEPDYDWDFGEGNEGNESEEANIALATKVEGMACSEYILGTLVVRVAAAKYLQPVVKGGLGHLLWGNGEDACASSGKNTTKNRRRLLDNGTSNPYAKLTFGGNVQRTAAVYGTTDPVWPREEQSYFDVSIPVPNLAHVDQRGEGKDIATMGTIFETPKQEESTIDWSSVPPPPKPILTVVLLHADEGKIGKNKNPEKKGDEVLLGSVALDLTQVLTGKVQLFDKWVPLGGGSDISGEVRIICEYDAADPPPRHGDMCRFTGFCDPADLFPAPPTQIFRVDNVDGYDVILSYTSPEGWLCTFKAHRYMLICAVRHQAAIEKYEAEILDIVERLAVSPLVCTVKATVDRVPDEGLLYIGREAVTEGAALLNRWLDGGVETAVGDIVYATNWDGQHSPNELEDGDSHTEEHRESAEGEGRKGMCKGEEAEAESHMEEKELVPGMPCCPITGEPMRDPVVAADGHTYERRAIMRWLQESDKSPLTGGLLSHKELVPNYMLLSTFREGKLNDSDGAAATLEHDAENNRKQPYDAKIHRLPTDDAEAVPNETVQDENGNDELLDTVDEAELEQSAVNERNQPDGTKIHRLPTDDTALNDTNSSTSDDSGDETELEQNTDTERKEFNDAEIHRIPTDHIEEGSDETVQEERGNNVPDNSGGEVEFEHDAET